MSDVLIYKSSDNQTQVEVKFENETVWLTLNQIADIFERDKSVISRHLKNIFESGELDQAATVAKNATVQIEAGRKITRNIEYYNLDAILSVGYRVNSKRGTQFRQWATQRLKEYLVKGYALNQQRLEQLNQVVNIIQQSGGTIGLQLTESKGLLDILSGYTRSFVMLNRYDSKNLETAGLTENITYEIKYAEAIATIPISAMYLTMARHLPTVASA